MNQANDIVDILLEEESIDLEAFVRGAGVMSPPKAAKMRDWLQARLHLGIRESEEPAPEPMNMGIDMDKFLRDAGVTVTMDDFICDGSPDRFGRWSNGNYTWSVRYKRLLYKGKPVFLGLVTGCHDYNRTQSTALVHFYAKPPTTIRDYHPMNIRTGERYKRAKQRTQRGYGAVHFNPPKSGESSSFDALFPACKWLLSLLKIQAPLKQAESLVSTMLS